MSSCQNSGSSDPSAEVNQIFTCSSGCLEGHACSDLYAMYLGIRPKSTIKDSIFINPYQVLGKMWDKKVKKSPSPVVRETRKKLLLDYTATNQCSFDSYTKRITEVVSEVREDIDWEILRKSMRMSDRESYLARDIVSAFDGRDMTAYIMTELMPSADGQFNRQVLNVMLMTGGSEFVERIPAIGDRKTSFGPYQFTEYALFHTPKEMRGASVVNAAIKNERSKIPGSVSKLRGDDHHRAAYMFAVYNVCHLVKILNKRQFTTLERRWKSNQDDLFIYCATAHHAPAHARTAAKKWLRADVKYPFEHSCGKSILGYAIKTRANLRAI